MILISYLLHGGTKGTHELYHMWTKFYVKEALLSLRNCIKSGILNIEERCVEHEQKKIAHVPWRWDEREANTNSMKLKWRLT